jgi:hypothetical protein
MFTQKKLLKKYDLFDFDKTLTFKDTLYGFYITCNDGKISFLKKHIYFLASILNYTNVINNTTFKRIGVKLFLVGKAKSKIDAYSIQYSENILLNELYLNVFKKCKNKIIITASFENYVKKVFANDDNVITYGSSLNYDQNSNVCGLKNNLYGITKRKYLFNKGYKYFESFYTDSMSDKYLFSMSKDVYIVNNGKYKKHLK